MSADMVSPLTIQIAIACHVSTLAEEHVGEVTWESPAGREVRAWLKANDLVNPNHEGNDKLAAWVQKICETPLPFLAWSYDESHHT